MQQSRSAPFAIFGGGGFGREIAWLARSDPSARFAPVCFVDDSPAPSAGGVTARTDADPGRIADLPVLTLERFVDAHDGVPLVISVGSPSVRRRIAERLDAAGLEAITLVHDRVRLDPSVSLGAGTVLCDGVMTTVDAAIGRHVHVNLGCTVGHDVRIGDFVTLSPGVHVSGNVTIERDVFVGTGATIINGVPDAPLVLGANGIIGAGAVVTGSTEPDRLHVGIPARPVARR